MIALRWVQGTEVFIRFRYQRCDAGIVDLRNPPNFYIKAHLAYVTNPFSTLILALTLTTSDVFPDWVS